MTFSYIDHRTLPQDDIAALEGLITAYREHGGHPPRPEPVQGEWVLVIHSGVTGPDGEWLETEGVFKRWGSTQLTSDGRTHTEFVDMQFTEEGQALPGRGYGARPTSAPHHPAATPPVQPHAPSPRRGR